MKLKKKSNYNLSDGEEDEFNIEGVSSFSERDDFEDEVLPDDDDVDGEEGAGTESMLELPTFVHGVGFPYVDYTVLVLFMVLKKVLVSYEEKILEVDFRFK